MHQTDPRRSLLGMLLSAVVVGALAGIPADSATLAVGLGVLLLVGMAVTTTVAAIALGAPGAVVPGAGRLRRQWGRAPIPLLDPGLAGRPQPRAPGRHPAEVLVTSPAR
ncbi:hypothetical protein MWU75_01410 [Ornithinimicrobium sp. F0845]|uniref:hypothetical protein n=1 Tax=Ornithinimicrobium sp. F0845 TaxID=2926412 RepID=UPI001FF1581C|nr:hypothetical protein [Ornithinimicrobium sp. F0845]MCK0110800.1 hypothetical protein [Ornithinimicrobium sp. F0845]